MNIRYGIKRVEGEFLQQKWLEHKQRSWSRDVVFYCLGIFVVEVLIKISVSWYVYFSNWCQKEFRW